MKVKKYTAATMPEVMKQIRAELGEQAVLLQTKTVYTGGFFGLFKKKSIEVVAAIDPNPHTAPHLKKSAVFNEHPLQLKKEKHNGEALTKELNELKEIVKQISKADPFSSDTYPEELRRPIIKLQKQEVAEEFVSELKQQLLDKWKEEKGQVSEALADEWSREWLIEKIKPIQDKQPAISKKFINIVGPTGVGKTTTLAKMAAGSVLEQKFKTAFITTDTYRIGAIEQLKTYADLLKVPVEIVYQPVEMKRAIEKFKEYEIVYIDTAGRNYLEKPFIEELKTMIPFDRMKNYLVVSLTAKEPDIHAMIQQFSDVPIDQFIFTKVDETTSRGAIVNVMCRYGKGAAFLTNGQNVPDDLIQPNAKEIADIILGDHL
ncbi:flagellar biosynthesis protein FlhF [Bacillus sp. B190/17]|uniref:Flagellar biosynthesis protein FlhF n=1 Tax=Bacillus lumedeiriae TaxID=3058829 RepID=A0ABW8I6C5_9BACI